ncbi:hypothetical protein PZA18_11665 [Chitinimonas sp. DQS-5]|uniref:Uncharacterized protein n=1 Tax=Parachitinimonas caeni TaxID=3031301 RepID=A0ABT7E1C2_9NEIS|nr:hypothetical protein [Parachitinimonas caeni]
MHPGKQNQIIFGYRAGISIPQERPEAGQDVGIGRDGARAAAFAIAFDRWVARTEFA